MKGRVRKTDIVLVHAENPTQPWLSEKLQPWDGLSEPIFLPQVLRCCCLGHSKKWPRWNFARCDHWKTKHGREMMHTVGSLAFGPLRGITLKTTEKRKQDDLIIFAKENAIMNLDKIGPWKLELCLQPQFYSPCNEQGCCCWENPAPH